MESKLPITIIGTPKIVFNGKWTRIAETRFKKSGSSQEMVYSLAVCRYFHNYFFYLFYLILFNFWFGNRVIVRKKHEIQKLMEWILSQYLRREESNILCL